MVSGTFQYCRNPGYVAVISLVAGQGLLFPSGAVLIYTAFLWLAFHLFVRLYEEPDLRGRFGAEYEDYCRRVPRWIPRRATPTQGATPEPSAFVSVREII